MNTTLVSVEVKNYEKFSKVDELSVSHFRLSLIESATCSLIYGISFKISLTVLKML